MCVRNTSVIQGLFLIALGLKRNGLLSNDSGFLLLLRMELGMPRIWRQGPRELKSVFAQTIIWARESWVWVGVRGPSPATTHHFWIFYIPLETLHIFGARGPPVATSSWLNNKLTSLLCGAVFYQKQTSKTMCLPYNSFRHRV